VDIVYPIHEVRRVIDSRSLFVGGSPERHVTGQAEFSP
jgi:hypothetical protein